MKIKITITIGNTYEAMMEMEGVRLPEAIKQATVVAEKARDELGLGGAEIIFVAEESWEDA